MEVFVAFLNTHGLYLTGIALMGIIILGILKYANLFKAVTAEKRKAIYLTISIGLSYLGSVIYLIYTNQSMTLSPIVFSSIYALNQAMYSIYENTSLRTLVQKGIIILLAQVEKILKGEQNGENKD